MNRNRPLPPQLASSALPTPTWLGLDTPREVAAVLARTLPPHVTARSSETDDAADNPAAQPELTVAGDGNMNVTLRASWGEQSWIVKQARPFVAKYDSIPAPLNRAAHEAGFYQFIQQHDELAARMPRLLAWLPDQHVLVLEDLGRAADLTSLYEPQPASSFGKPSGRDEDAEWPAELDTLASWLTALHNLSRGQCDADRFANRELRRLNHAHIFRIPFAAETPVDLDAICPGLAAASRNVRRDAGLGQRIAQLGERYLGDGPCLLHGDFYPGSWLRTAAGAHVIDPEFCFVGPPEFDIGVMLGHMQICGFAAASDQLRRRIEPRATVTPEWPLVQQFAAVEILRRLLGVAQLPLRRSLAEYRELIELAAAWLA